MSQAYDKTATGLASIAKIGEELLRRLGVLVSGAETESTRRITTWALV